MKCVICKSRMLVRKTECRHCGARYTTDPLCVGSIVQYILGFLGFFIIISPFTDFFWQYWLDLYEQIGAIAYTGPLLSITVLSIFLDLSGIGFCYKLNTADMQTKLVMEQYGHEVERFKKNA